MKDLLAICMEIYRELYKQATPSADFDKLIKNKTTSKPDWFMKYYLPSEKLKEIFDRICKEHKLSRRETKAIKFEVYLGCAPNSCKETCQERRKKKKKVKKK